MPVQLPRIDDLSTPEGLEAIVGPVQSIERLPLATVGFSQARHERLTVHLGNGSDTQFVLKRFTPASSWTAYRTGDAIGREAALLAEPALAGVWEVFRNPYRAFAAEGGEVGLLMMDLTDVLLPHDGSPLDELQEDNFLRSLAALHARFWESDALRTSWLAPLWVRFQILHPTSGTEELKRSTVAPVFALVQRGWEIALRTVPAHIAARLQRPAAEIARDFSHLPHTLLHGDTKVANFGFYSRGKVASFDWATVGKGPATIDLGYCLAINSAKLSRDKESVICRYRGLLETGLGRKVPDGMWEQMVTAAVVAGAGMLLWSKALALDDGTPGAAAEWAWWVSELEQRIDL
jgi:hypothetical protein